VIEEEIARSEQRLAELAGELAKPEVARDPARLARVNADYGNTEEQIRVLYEEWEQVAAETTSA
jgi:hypothetical protein